MNLDSLFPVTAEMEFDHPVLGKQGFILELRGVDSPEVNRKFIALQIATMNKESEDEINRRQVELVASAVVNWRGLKDKDGNEVPFTTEKALQFATDSIPFRRSIDHFILDRQKFFR